MDRWEKKKKKKEKGWKGRKSVEYSIASGEKWSDSSFVARIGKKRLVPPPPARRGGSKAQATSERERRAGEGEEGERAQRGVDFSHWPGAWDGAVACTEPRTSRLLRVFIGDREWLSGYFSLPARYFCKIGFSCEKARDPDYLPSLPSSSSSKRVSRGSSNSSARIYIYISFSTIETRPDHLFLATSNEKIDSTFKGEAKETRLRRLCLKDCKNVGILHRECDFVFSSSFSFVSLPLPNFHFLLL